MGMDACTSLDNHASTIALVIACMQGYTPSLIVSEYKTLVSLITSLLVISAFLTAVAYTTYIWVVADLNQTGEGLRMTSRGRAAGMAAGGRYVVY